MTDRKEPDMKFKYDKTTKVGYVSIKDGKDHAESVRIFKDGGVIIIIDKDKAGQVTGIEIVRDEGNLKEIRG